MEKRLFIVSFTSVDCRIPGGPQGGSVENYTGTTEGSEVFYSCNQGLVPVGRMRANCTENGQWSPNPADVSCMRGKWKCLIDLSH